VGPASGLVSDQPVLKGEQAPAGTGPAKQPGGHC